MLMPSFFIVFHLDSDPVYLTVLSAEQSLKAFSLMKVNAFGIIIVLRALQPSKALFSIDTTFFTIVTVSSPVQPENV